MTALCHLSYNHLSYTSFVLHGWENFICPTHHLSYTSFVLHIICPTSHLSYTSFVLHLICPTHHLSYTSFVLHGWENFICPTHHLSYTSFVLHLICPTLHLSYRERETLFVLQLITSLVLYKHLKIENPQNSRRIAVKFKYERLKNLCSRFQSIVNKESYLEQISNMMHL